jgi:nitrite reductase (NADH) small subunit
MVQGLAAVTVFTADLAAARRLYEGLLGFQPVAAWRASPDEAGGRALGALWGLPSPLAAAGVWLQQRGARAGAIHLVALEPPPPGRLTDGARPYDHGYIKNLDVFTDDVEALYARLSASGVAFLGPPVAYPLPWGLGSEAIEAHLVTDDGVKVSLARLRRAPRRVFGEADAATPCTEVAAATQVVADHDRAVRFYADVFGCVPAAPTVIDDARLVAMLRLPPDTRLRLSFIGPPEAVGGKVGLVAYEGPGVADARALGSRASGGARGAWSLAFETDDVDGTAARAALHGAEAVMVPSDATLPHLGPVRAASLRTADGVLIELVDRAPTPEGLFVPLAEAASLAEGQLRAVSAPGMGRLVLGRTGGQVFALEDRCPHLGAPLSRGVLRGRAIVCPWHGWLVDLPTGKVDGACGVRARRCPLRVVGGTVCGTAHTRRA